MENKSDFDPIQPPTHPTPKPAPAPVRDPEIPRPRGTLQDYLALERTALSNERTMLAYVRTSLALLAAAFTLLKFFPGKGMQILGYALIPAGVVCLTIGFMRFFETRHHLEKLISENNMVDPPAIK